MNAKNIIGRKFNRWTVIGRAANRGTRAYWVCKCECGTIKEVCGTSLRTNGTYSCGCYRSETTTRTKTIHGLNDTPLYVIWGSMRARCRVATSPDYKNYGGRGISVCCEWDDFGTFYRWAQKNGYREGLTIERIDNSGNYNPDNCRWANRKEQANNKRNNRYVSYMGKKLTVMQLSEILNVHYKGLWSAIDRHGVDWAVSRYAG